MRALRILFLLAAAVVAIAYTDFWMTRALVLAAFFVSYAVACSIGGSDVPIDPIQPEPIASLNLSERALRESQSRRR